MTRRVRALVHAWLVLDFFGDARRSGAATSTLTTTIFTQSFLALVFAALLYPETPPIPFVAANLTLSSLLVAVGSLDHQEGHQRRLADRVLLATSPIDALTALLARAGHASFQLCLVTIGMALPPAVLLAFLRDAWLPAFGYVLLACACSGLFAGGLAVLLRGLGRALGPARAALVAGSCKAMLLGGGVVAFALGMQRLRGTAADLPGGRATAELLPPYHAARLLADPFGEGWRLGVLLGAGLVLVLLALWFGDGEPNRRARVGRFAPLRRCLLRLAPPGPGLGIADFVAVTMWRSPGFRARVLPLLGLPAGMVVLSLPGTEPRHAYLFTCLLLQLPAIYLPFLIAFLPRADQAEAAWLFEQVPLSRTLVQDATWRALVTHVLLPVHAVALVLLLVARPSIDVVAAAAFSFAVAIVASRFLVRALPCVPFTAAAEGETALDLGALFAVAVVLGGVGTAFGALPVPALRWGLVGFAGAAAAMLLARRPAAETGLPAAAPAAAERMETAPAQADPPEAPAAAPSLQRELRAIAVLYGAVCVLPVLIGTVFAG